MAAFETPWMVSMAPTTSTMTTPASPGGAREDPNQATTASFSPAQSISSYQRRNVLVHQNTPLLIATPPQVTRALAFSHPFLLPLNKFIGLISWSSGDPWESFLVVSGFWALVLFGSEIVKWSGPLLAVAGLVAGMYGRRYSPLSTRSADETAKGHRHKPSDAGMRHQKSLDEIVETLNTFTARCNLMLNPLLELTDFLSTPQSATSASTRPALTTLFIRLLMTLPLWIALTLPPLRLITTQRVVMVVGTIFLTWHSRPARISRTILWRNLSVRYIVSLLTGLDFGSPAANTSTVEALIARGKNQQEAATSAVSTGKRGKGSVRFTFTLYENQRRWLGIGWTSSMFAYERASWTDEQLNWSLAKEKFQLPHVDGGAKWRWVPGSEWRVENAGGMAKDGDKGRGSSGGWIYYDNKWHDPRRQDGWNRYTRRRKWYRDAELVEKGSGGADSTSEPAQPSTPGRGRAETGASGVSSEGGNGPTELPAGEVAGSAPSSAKPTMSQLLASGDASVSASGSDAKSGDRSLDDSALLRSSGTSAESGSSRRRRGLFSRRSRSRLRRRDTGERTPPAGEREAGVTRSDDEQERRRSFEEEQDWLVGDDVKMGLS